MHQNTSNIYQNISKYMLSPKNISKYIKNISKYTLSPKNADQVGGGGLLEAASWLHQGSPLLSIKSFRGPFRCFSCKGSSINYDYNHFWASQ